MSSTFEDLKERALQIRERYDSINNPQWNTQQLAMGFAGDMGQLMKLVMAKEGLRRIENIDEKLAHELADCLWSILVLADKYGIDLEKSFYKTMDELDERIGENKR